MGAYKPSPVAGAIVDLAERWVRGELADTEEVRASIVAASWAAWKSAPWVAASCVAWAALESPSWSAPWAASLETSAGIVRKLRGPHCPLVPTQEET